MKAGSENLSLTVTGPVTVTFSSVGEKSAQERVVLLLGLMKTPW